MTTLCINGIRCSKGHLSGAVPGDLSQQRTTAVVSLGSKGVGKVRPDSVWAAVSGRACLAEETLGLVGSIRHIRGFVGENVGEAARS